MLLEDPQEHRHKRGGGTGERQVCRYALRREQRLLLCARSRIRLREQPQYRGQEQRGVLLKQGAKPVECLEGAQREHSLRRVVRLDDRGKERDELGGVRRERLAQQHCQLLEQCDHLQEQRAVPMHAHELEELWDPRLQVSVHCGDERRQLLHQVIEDLRRRRP